MCAACVVTEPHAQKGSKKVMLAQQGGFATRAVAAVQVESNTLGVVQHDPLRVQRDGRISVASVPASPRRAIVPPEGAAGGVESGAFLDAEERRIDLHVQLRARRTHFVFAASDTLRTRTKHAHTCKRT
jgi:hypothetical protein